MFKHKECTAADSDIMGTSSASAANQASGQSCWPACRKRHTPLLGCTSSFESVQVCHHDHSDSVQDGGPRAGPARQVKTSPHDYRRYPRRESFSELTGPGPTPPARPLAIDSEERRVADCAHGPGTVPTQLARPGPSSTGSASVRRAGPQVVPVLHPRSVRSRAATPWPA